MPKTRFQIMLEPDQLHALRKLQEASGAPVAEHMRRAITDYLGKSSKRVAKKVGRNAA